MIPLLAWSSATQPPGSGTVPEGRLETVSTLLHPACKVTHKLRDLSNSTDPGDLGPLGQPSSRPSGASSPHLAQQLPFASALQPLASGCA